MPSLHEWQRAFSAAAVFSDAAALASLRVVAGGMEPEARIGIYRANVLGNYRRALAATYPVIKRLVGVPFFDAASDNFVRGHPSTRGDINRYGADFSEFLRTYPPARDLKYLPDVARLEDITVNIIQVVHDGGPAKSRPDLLLRVITDSFTKRSVVQ